MNSDNNSVIYEHISVKRIHKTKTVNLVKSIFYHFIDIYNMIKEKNPNVRREIHKKFIKISFK